MLRLSSPQLDPTGVGSLKLLLAVRCTELNRGLARALSPRSRPQCIAPLSTATSHVARGSEAKSSRMLGNSRALVADPIPPTGSLPTFTICSCGDRDEDGHGNQLNGELGETLVKAAIQGLGHVFEGRGRLALGGVDLTSSTGKLTMTVINTVAEFQCDLLIERTQVGLSRAKAEEGAWQTPEPDRRSAQSGRAAVERGSDRVRPGPRDQRQPQHDHVHAGRQGLHRHEAARYAALSDSSSWTAASTWGAISGV